MAFDAYFLTAVLEEVREKCIGARIDKIHQPSRDTLILQMHSREYKTKLLFAANPTAPRLHLTTSSPENPAEPPMFCMLLRKHLMGESNPSSLYYRLILSCQHFSHLVYCIAVF